MKKRPNSFSQDHVAKLECSVQDVHVKLVKPSILRSEMNTETRLESSKKNHQDVLKLLYLMLIISVFCSHQTHHLKKELYWLLDWFWWTSHTSKRSQRDKNMDDYYSYSYSYSYSYQFISFNILNSTFYF